MTSMHSGGQLQRRPWRCALCGMHQMKECMRFSLMIVRRRVVLIVMSISSSINIAWSLPSPKFLKEFLIFLGWRDCLPMNGTSLGFLSTRLTNVQAEICMSTRVLDPMFDWCWIQCWIENLVGFVRIKYFIESTFSVFWLKKPL